MVGAVATLAAAAASTALGPVSSAQPTVAGRAVEGGRLTGSTGAWSGSGRLKYAYQWYRCDPMGAHCALLRGVTGKSHLLGGNDVGHTLDLRVRAVDSTGSATAYSSLVGPVAGTPARLVPIAQPTVSGAVEKGGTVRVDPGRWRPKPSAFSYQWLRCNGAGRACAPISGATGDTHAIVDDDLGHSLLAIVQARSGASLQAVLSAPAAAARAVAPPPSREAGGPTPTSPPLVAEVLQEGNRLTGAVGSWTGSGAVSFAYQWYRCDPAGAHCTSIHGATRPTYTLVARDVGHTLGFAVRASDAVGTTSAYGSLVGPVAASSASLVSTGQPTVAGEATEGQTLLVSGGAWIPSPGSLSYQWERCNSNGRLCVPIAGATASSYVVASVDAGHALLAVVRATAGPASQDALSAATAAVAALETPGPSSSAPPTATGQVQQGKQLTGTAGSWTGSGAVSYAYQWYRCDPAGAHCKSIHGATGTTYTLVARDVGQTLGFAVRGSDAAGTTSAYASLLGPVAAPGAAAVSTAQPTVAGVPKAGQLLQVSNGTWSVTPSAYAYQWERCNPNGRLCVPVVGATGSTYMVSAPDVGHALLAAVRGGPGDLGQESLSTAVVVAP